MPASILYITIKSIATTVAERKHMKEPVMPKTRGVKQRLKCIVF